VVTRSQAGLLRRAPHTCDVARSHSGRLTVYRESVRHASRQPFVEAEFVRTPTVADRFRTSWTSSGTTVAPGAPPKGAAVDVERENNFLTATTGLESVFAIGPRTSTSCLTVIISGPSSLKRAGALTLTSTAVLSIRTLLSVVTASTLTVFVVANFESVLNVPNDSSAPAQHTHRRKNAKAIFLCISLRQKKSTSLTIPTPVCAARDEKVWESGRRATTSPLASGATHRVEGWTWDDDTRASGCSTRPRACPPHRRPSYTLSQVQPYGCPKEPYSANGACDMHRSFRVTCHTFHFFHGEMCPTRCVPLTRTPRRTTACARWVRICL